MAYENATNYNLLKSMRGYAIGTIIPWSGTQQNTPTGWLFCDGSNVPAAEYPLLYRRIGTTYGGIVTATGGGAVFGGDIYTGSFNLPNLPGNGISDIYRNHYAWLQGSNSSIPRGEAHTTAIDTSNTITDATGAVLDEFWNRTQVTADTLTEFAGNYSSEMDLVGEFRNPVLDTLTASVTEIEFIGGEYEDTAFILGRKLSDKHWRGHTHGVGGYNPSQETNSIRPKDSNYMDGCRVQLPSDIFCSTSVVCTSPLEPNAMEVPGGQNNEYGTPWFLSPVNYREGTGAGYIAQSGASGLPSYIPNFVAGGGGIRSGAQTPGDGRSQGDMESQRQFDRDFPTGLAWSFSNSSVIPSPETARLFQTSLSNTEVLWSEVLEHEHGTVELVFSSRLRPIATYTWNDIKLGSVTINNATGDNAARIDAVTLTPTLSTLFIIKAF